MSDYAVAWREDAGAIRSGRLELAEKGLRLEGGSHRRGRASVRALRYRDLLKTEMAPSKERIGGRPTILVMSGSGSLYIAPTGAGLAREVLGLLQGAL